MKIWICPECTYEVMSVSRPKPFVWKDGHVCHLRECIECGICGKVVWISESQQVKNNPRICMTCWRSGKEAKDANRSTS